MRKPSKKKRSKKLVSRPRKTGLQGLVPMTYEVAKALYGTPAYKAWRDFVLKRDLYQCQMCGQKGGALEAHHIRPKKRFPELTLVEENGITLCKECHQNIVTGKEHFFSYIFSRIVILNTRRMTTKPEVMINGGLQPTK